PSIHLLRRMKINDRVLCHYAGCPQGFDKEGSLCIRGEANKSFQKRHFVFSKEIYLFYFEK
ncbi:CG12393 CG12393PAlike, partial [Caligus rogercresseyi]